MKTSDKIMLINFATVREMLEEYGWDSERITELYNTLIDSGVDLEDLRERRRKGNTEWKA